MSRPVLAAEDVFKRILAQDLGNSSSYKAAYISWWGGIVTDPRLMLIPLDDHMVHRGDGVFEAVKAVQGKPYLLEEHLERLKRSAEKISLSLPESTQEIKKLVLQTLQVSKLESAILRLFVSRGTGSFSPNPYDSKGAGLAIIATELRPLASEKYSKGVRIGRSQVAPKSSFWAQIKSCNYLPNVLMKKESVDRGLDFTVGFNEKGYVTESSTENIIWIDEKGRLCQPHLEQILKGCTMTRVMELAQQNSVCEVACIDLTEENLLRAQEVMMVGTTLDVLPVTQYENHRIAEGKVGPFAQKLLKLLLEDQKK